jgi:hypothetical protein
MPANTPQAPLAPSVIDVTAHLMRLRQGEPLQDIFECLDGPAIRRCLIAIGVIRPGPRREAAAVGRYLKEGEYLRQRCYEDIPGAPTGADGKPRKRFTGVVGVWKVPATLRIDALGAPRARQASRDAHGGS